MLKYWGHYRHELVTSERPKVPPGFTVSPPGFPYRPGMSELGLKSTMFMLRFLSAKPGLGQPNCTLHALASAATVSSWLALSDLWPLGLSGGLRCSSLRVRAPRALVVTSVLNTLLQ